MTKLYPVYMLAGISVKQDLQTLCKMIQARLIVAGKMEYTKTKHCMRSYKNELRNEKNCLRGFPTGPTPLAGCTPVKDG